MARGGLRASNAVYDCLRRPVRSADQKLAGSCLLIVAPNPSAAVVRALDLSALMRVDRRQVQMLFDASHARLEFADLNAVADRRCVIFNRRPTICSPRSLRVASKSDAISARKELSSDRSSDRSFFVAIFPRISPISARIARSISRIRFSGSLAK